MLQWHARGVGTSMRSLCQQYRYLYFERHHCVHIPRHPPQSLPRCRLIANTGTVEAHVARHRDQTSRLHDRHHQLFMTSARALFIPEATGVEQSVLRDIVLYVPGQVEATDVL